MACATCRSEAPQGAATCTIYAAKADEMSVTCRLDSYGLQVVAEFLLRDSRLSSSEATSLASLYACEIVKLVENLAVHPMPLVFLGKETSAGTALFDALEKAGAVRGDAGVPNPKAFDKECDNNAAKDAYKRELMRVCHGGPKSRLARRAVVGFLRRELGLWYDESYKPYDWYGRRSVGLSSNDYDVLFKDTWRGDVWRSISNSANDAQLRVESRKRRLAPLLNFMLFRHFAIARSTALNQSTNGRVYYPGPTRSTAIDTQAGVLGLIPEKEYAYADLVQTVGIPSLGWYVLLTANSRRELFDRLVLLGTGATSTRHRRMRKVLHWAAILREADRWATELEALDYEVRRESHRALQKYRKSFDAPVFLRRVASVFGDIARVHVLSQLLMGKSLMDLNANELCVEAAVALAWNLVRSECSASAPSVKNRYFVKSGYWRSVEKKVVALSRSPPVTY